MNWLSQSQDINITENSCRTLKIKLQNHDMDIKTKQDISETVTDSSVH